MQPPAARLSAMHVGLDTLPGVPGPSQKQSAACVRRDMPPTMLVLPTVLFVRHVVSTSTSRQPATVFAPLVLSTLRIAENKPKALVFLLAIVTRATQAAMVV